MTFLKSVAENSHAAHIFAAHPQIYKLYSMASRAIMRGPSPLSPAQRELIGAFVSALNRCEFCYGAHRVTARLFGYPDDAVEKLLVDIDAAPVEDELKPILAFVEKLTKTPEKMTQCDADAVFAAGWDDDALHSAVAVVSTFHFMNRFAAGLGIDPDAQDFEALGAERFASSYTPMAPIEASKIADDLDEAYAKSPPDWERIWRDSPAPVTRDAKDPK